MIERRDRPVETCVRIPHIVGPLEIVVRQHVADQGGVPAAEREHALGHIPLVRHEAHAPAALLTGNPRTMALLGGLSVVMQRIILAPHHLGGQVGRRIPCHIMGKQHVEQLARPDGRQHQRQDVVLEVLLGQRAQVVHQEIRAAQQVHANRIVLVAAVHVPLEAGDGCRHVRVAGAVEHPVAGHHHVAELVEPIVDLLEDVPIHPVACGRPRAGSFDNPVRNAVKHMGLV